MSCLIGTFKSKYGGVEVNDIISTFLDKFGVTFQIIFFNNWQEGRKTICQAFGELLVSREEIIPITIQWENGMEASEDISFLILKKHERALRTIFARKNLHASERDIEGAGFSEGVGARQKFFICSLNAFLDWSRNATEWNRKTARN